MKTVPDISDIFTARFSPVSRFLFLISEIKRNRANTANTGWEISDRIESNHEAVLIAINIPTFFSFRREIFEEKQGREIP